MPEDRSVVVVGAGIIGLCTAYYAAAKGFRVTVLERGGPDHDCCSAGNAGMVVPSHFIPLAAPGIVSQVLRMLLDRQGPLGIRMPPARGFAGWAWRFTRAASEAHVLKSGPLLRDLCLSSRACFDEMAREESDDFGLTRSGLLMLCKTEATLAHEGRVAEVARSLGLEATVLDPERLCRLEPGVRMDVAGGVYFRQDCYLDPHRLMRTLLRSLESRGVTFAWNGEVSGWRTAGDAVESVRTTAGEFSGTEYVVAGGAWSPRLLGELGLRLPLEAGKGYSVTLPAAPARPGICSILTEARIAVTPIGQGLRFAGTMEFAGLDSSVNRRRVTGMFRAIPRYFPDFQASDFQDLPVWSGLRPCSPDGLPYVGRSSRFRNLLVATGHAMLGVTLAPVTGKLVTSLLSGEQPEIDIEALSPGRFD